MKKDIHDSEEGEGGAGGKMPAPKVKKWSMFNTIAIAVIVTFVLTFLLVIFSN